MTHDLSAGVRQSWAGAGGSTSLRLGYRLLEQRNYGRAALLHRRAHRPGLHAHLPAQHHPAAGPRGGRGAPRPAGFNLTASIWLQWLRTYSTYAPGKGAYCGQQLHGRWTWPAKRGACCRISS